MKLTTQTVDIGGKTITFETGKYAKQASGAVVVSCGDSRIMVTVVCATSGRPFDFLPLTVDYQDRNGANGTIPGGYLKREGRSSERETLVSRLIDRPIRPLFPKHFRNEIQIIATTMSYDKDNETDVLAFCGAAAACHISNAPVAEAAAAVRVCRVDGELILNPSFEQMESADVNMVVGGTKESITMVEGSCNEASEEDMLGVFALGHEAIKSICEALDAFRAEAGSEKMEIAPPPELNADVVAFCKQKWRSAIACSAGNSWKARAEGYAEGNTEWPD